MEVRIEALSKRFEHRWVFRDISLHVPAGSCLAVTGPNGSGKSTFLKIIGGLLHASSGHISHIQDGRLIPPDDVSRTIAFAAPYAEMIEEMTLQEAYRFHAQFRSMHPDCRTFDAFREMLEFDFHKSQQLRFMSSGMKQRLRLALALCTDAALFLLDEPTSNLDDQGNAWFHALMQACRPGRTIVIASNVHEDLTACTQRLALLDYTEYHKPPVQ
jgi:ABC-type multidrug transport system ATPase subunit